jgi:broad specificity phosphatase PhoE
MVRLLLLCHGSTAATRTVGFPADEPLESRAVAKIRAIHGHFGVDALASSSPARCALQTATEMGLDAVVDDRLRDQDFGRWKGRSLADVEREERDALFAFMTDPAATPHGGESFANVVERASAWLDDLASTQGKHIAVTHAAFVRAAVLATIGARPEQRSRFDIPPLSCTELRTDGRRWVWRAQTVIPD